MDIKAIANPKSKANANDNLLIIDARITLQVIKERKTKRTYVLGLHHFLTPEQINTFVSDTKVRLGTSGLSRKQDDGTTYYGFQGDHMNAIKTILTDDLHIDKSKIKDVV